MKKKLIYSGIGILLVFLLLLGTYKLMNSRTFQLFGGLTDQVKTDQKVVALTFDDGPTKNVEKILPLLQQYNVKATFFLIGNEIEKNPEEAKKIVSAGHQIGNHTYSHQRMVFKSPSYIKEEMEKTDKLIRESGYKGKIDFRPPNGKKLVGLPYYLYKNNRDTITWSLEPDTYYTSATDKVSYVKKNVKPGSIILIHPMYDGTGDELNTIKGILQSLSNEGYKFITVNELLKLKK
ncbi:polysaccharide deacetylase family protein [Bacillus sp. ISL-40]|uniref:polysaccharide deacetylase family protein n=1 Tax=unclassified Bacillus (in: firmicutes) TaxID=185979 RepID=UPI001BE63FAB|nr:MULTISPECIES: polysaccharide deacetylase family protein [unclassified Bacillus (in: firmicutes)]MBT2695834.1 polysaccharide deacetylase family protein [Bacillus sp. ISL-40]MBT2724473.1 polysaccharide deacetylase family protein [Bacillus sp. ISL-46]MBT2743686.1 polysaccharide deacetylase family protein [Bacillus sp. ISL-77]